MPRQTRGIAGFSQRLNALRKDLGSARISGEFGQKAVDKEIRKIADEYKQDLTAATPSSEGTPDKLRSTKTQRGQGYPAAGTLRRSWYVERKIALSGRQGLSAVEGTGNVPRQQGRDVIVQVKNRDPRLKRTKQRGARSYDLIDHLHFGTRAFVVGRPYDMVFWVRGNYGGAIKRIETMRVRHPAVTKHVGFMDQPNQTARKNMRNLADRLRRKLKSRGLFGRNR